jgi:IS5 family transposase
MQKKTSQLSFSSLALAKRKLKTVFFDQMNALINWKEVEQTIEKYYRKGKSTDGRPAYNGLLLFKICLLQTWYGLSDYEIEEQVNDSLSFMRFLDLTLEDSVPDHSVISRFRTTLSELNVYEELLVTINKQLEKKNILVNKGIIVDASVTDTLRKPRGKKEYQVVEDRKEENIDLIKVAVNNAVSVKIASNVDREAGWIKKGGKIRYGYKKHVATNEEGLVLAVVTTAANESDTIYLKEVVDKVNIEKWKRVRADKGYSSCKNREYLKKKELKNGIMYKAEKNKPLNVHQQRFNNIVSQVRYKIERTFGSIKLWFKTGIARYVGRSKIHAQHLIESIAYNLYRSPGIIMSNT